MKSTKRIRMQKLLRQIGNALLKQLILRWRMRQAHDHALPNFLIIGVQKGGTTSLYDNLVRHPQIIPALKKEVHYFDWNSQDFDEPRRVRSLQWYQAHFPHKNALAQGNTITGEATPAYILFPQIPYMLKEIVPDVRLIVLLRDPVKRAYSHYQMYKRNTANAKPFDVMIENEIAIIEQLGLEDVLSKKKFSDAKETTFISRGLYAVQLERWLSQFRRDQFLFLKSENYFDNPLETLQNVTDFLGILQWQYGYQKTAMESYTYAPLAEATRSRLQEFYRPYNQVLQDNLGIDFQWLK